MSTRAYPETHEEAEQRFYAVFSQRINAHHWRDILVSCQALGLPQPARPESIEDWIALANTINVELHRRGRL